MSGLAGRNLTLAPDISSREERPENGQNGGWHQLQRRYRGRGGDMPVIMPLHNDLHPNALNPPVYKICTSSSTESVHATQHLQLKPMNFPSV